MAASAGIDFCTLGMFIIDDIYPSPHEADQTPRLGIPGGAGTYCAIGARLVSPPPLSRSVGWIIDRGHDFPEALLDTIERWRTGAVWRTRDGQTTRGWNGYSENQHRDFRYLTPKVRLDEADLTPELLKSRSFHMVCSQERCMDLVQGITARRKQLDDTLEQPVFVYEPVPDLAVPSALEATLATLKHVQVISPNHAELAHIFDRRADLYVEEVLDRSLIEQLSQWLLDRATAESHELIVVVRAGADGCLVATNGATAIKRWLPAVHGGQQALVVDPTGGGNGFLGGFAVGLVRTRDPVEAAVWASVSASLCIEQVGIPTLSHAEDGQELWNGVKIQDRLKRFRTQCIAG